MPMYLRRVSRRGQTFDNPVTGERAVILTDPLHRHPISRERFQVLRGRVGFAIGGAEKELGVGECAEVAPGVEHDWWQLGSESAEVIVEVDPGERFVEMVGTMFGLARDGRTNRKGLPRPLQLAVTARAYSDVMIVSTPPPWVQRLLFGVLAPRHRPRPRTELSPVPRRPIIGGQPRPRGGGSAR